jgi:hypothetical protein
MDAASVNCAILIPNKDLALISKLLSTQPEWPIKFDKCNYGSLAYTIGGMIYFNISGKEIKFTDCFLDELVEIYNKRTETYAFSSIYDFYTYQTWVIKYCFDSLKHESDFFNKINNDLFTNTTKYYDQYAINGELEYTSPGHERCKKSIINTLQYIKYHIERMNFSYKDHIIAALMSAIDSYILCPLRSTPINNPVEIIKPEVKTFLNNIMYESKMINNNVNCIYIIEDLYHAIENRFYENAEYNKDTGMYSLSKNSDTYKTCVNMINIAIKTLFDIHPTIATMKI